MINPRLVRLILVGWVVLGSLALSCRSALAADPVDKSSAIPGQFFSVVEPLTSESFETLSAAARQYVDRCTREGREPILVFEFVPGQVAPGRSDFGTSLRLADFISTKLGEAKRRIAFVSQPLRGYVTLAALACDEIVMGTKASLGPIAPDNPVDPALLRESTRVLAVRQGHDPDLYLGMLEPEKDLKAIRADDRQLHFEFAENVAEFKKSHQVIETTSAWDGGPRGVLTAAKARDMGFARWTADSRAEVAAAYQFAGRASDDPTLGQQIRPILVQLRGPIDNVKAAYLSRRIEQARQEGVNLLILEIDSPGGVDTAADLASGLLARVQDMKTVAYLHDRATGVATMLAFACSDMVLSKNARLGGANQILGGRNQRPEDLDERQLAALADRLSSLAKDRGYPVAVARAMVDASAVVLQARDKNTGASVFVSRTEADAEPDRYLDPVVVKSAGEALEVNAEEADGYGLGTVVSDLEELKALYGLRGKDLRIDGPTWVDSLVAFLTEPFVSWLLLFIGLFMLVLELKLPGIGLPAITSALAFLLFFWSHYLSGTADQLEIILFVVGMICLGLEIFVFPGFGVFGMAGVLLVLTSIVMASHTFVWPSSEYEYREMGHTLLQLTAAMFSVGGGAIVLARYFPSLPLFNRLILKPEPWTAAGEFDPAAKPIMEGYESLTYLIGETGRTTTVLRPSGKAKFGDQLLDVSADGFFIERDSLVEVVDVHGTKVIVKRVDA